jgi:iron-sulfur cluster repair protein YtfE (RIC family)
VGARRVGGRRRGRQDPIIGLVIRFPPAHRRRSYLEPHSYRQRKVEAVHAEYPQALRGLADTLQQMLGELEVQDVVLALRITVVEGA